MIIYALIVRTNDGMALSATTDFNDEINQTIKQSKKYVKLAAKKAARFPNRCTVNLGAHCLHFISTLGVTYLALCDLSYPPVLAFSFLNELMREFILNYETVRVNLARRPYSFIEFDNFIHKTRQRYNKPQRLSTHVNLSDLSAEIKLNPPQEISLNDIEPIYNGYHEVNIYHMVVGPPPKLEPLSWFAIVSLILSILLVLLGFYRGFSALELTANFEEFYNPSYLHGFMFLSESTVRGFQVYLILYRSRFRIFESWGCFLLLLVAAVMLWNLRDSVQRFLYISSAITSHLSIINRRYLKLPEYDV